MSTGKGYDNDRGFSLVELVIVVALMAVLMSMMAISYYVVGKANAKSIASDFNQALGNSQSSTMGRVDGNFDIYIDFDANGYSTFRIGATGDRHTLSDQKIDVRVWNGANYITLSNVRMRISFDKASGAVKSIRVGVSDDYTGGEELGYGLGISEYKFMIGKEDGKHYVVHLIKATGKHYVE